jgi:hypothetical protein
MKLSYRGVHYKEAPSALEVGEGGIGGRYRGQDWRFHYLRHIPEPPPVHNLKYRGTAYRTGQPSVAQLTEVAPPVAGVGRQTLLPLKKREVLDEITISHLRNICRSLEHRLQVARAKGDQNLVRLLEAESEQMVCPLK